eukprot:4636439-Alexandrium_andersonii.AAC.1
MACAAWSCLLRKKARAANRASDRLRPCPANATCRGLWSTAAARDRFQATGNATQRCARPTYTPKNGARVSCALLPGKPAAY